MANKAITVNWDSRINGPTAPDVTVTESDGQSTITWNAGTGVSNLSIDGLDASMFKSFSGQGTNQVSCTDENTNQTDKEYSYTIRATHTSGTEGAHDPKILNVGRTSPPLRQSRRAPEADI